MCSRLGANVAVTQLKSNNHVEGQLVFFFFSPSSAALYRRLGTVSKPTLFSLWLSRKKKVSFSYIHARNLSFWCLSVDYEQEAIDSSSVRCTYLHITVTVGHTCSAHENFDSLWCLLYRLPVSQFLLTVLKVLAYLGKYCFLSIHLVIYVSTHFSFWVHGPGSRFEERAHAAARCRIRFN